MSFPAGVETVLVRWGRGFLAAGDGTTARLSVVPVLVGTSRVVWAASGEPLLKIDADRASDDDGAGEVRLPAVDQPGWVDASGQPFADWAYKATVSYKSAQGRSTREEWLFKVVQGQTEVDLDLVVSGNAGVPSVAPIAFVSSINGLTGAVEVDAVPELLVDEKDEATLEAARAYTREQIEANPGGVSEDVVDQKIESAVAAIPEGVTEATVDAKITAAVADIPAPDVDLATVETKVSTAKTEAVGSAKTYTDGKISALPSTFKGDSLRNPRRVGDNVKVDVVSVNPATGAETSTETDLGNFRGPGWSAAEMVAAVGTSFHFGETPPPSPTNHGKPVTWIDTRSKTAWPVPAPVKKETAGTITIPDDEGATYKVAGVDKAPGTYSVAVGTTWAITAHAKVGYVLAGTVSWSFAMTGISNLNALAALITSDAPTNHLTLAGSTPFQDLGSSPRAWASTGATTAGEWGTTFTQGGGTILSESVATGFLTGGLTAFTVEAVVEPKGPANQHTYAGTFAASQNNFYALIVGYNKAVVANGRTAANAAVSATGGSVPPAPTHVAMVLADGTLTAYAAGVAVATQPFTSTLAATAERFVVGSSLNGNLGQFALYRGKALTAARIAQHAAAVGA